MSNTYAQSLLDTNQLAEKFQIAKNKVEEANYLSAIEEFGNILEAHALNQQWEKFYLVLIELYKTGWKSKNYQLVIDQVIKSRLLIKESETELLAKTDYIIGYIHDQLGNVVQSLNAYKKSNAALLILGDKKRLLGTYGNIGILYTKLGQYALAESNLKQAISIAKKINDNGELIRHISNLGIAQFYNNKLEDALNSYKEYQTVSKNNNGYYELKVSQVYQRLKNWTKALELANQALIKNKISDNELVGQIEKQLGSIYLDSSDYQKCLEHLRKSEEEILDVQDKRERVKLHVLTADAYYESDKIDQAFEYAQLGLNTLLTDSPLESIYTLPYTENLYPEKWFIDLLKLKGDCFIKLHNKTRDNKDLLAALEHFNLAIAQIDKIKLFYSDISSKYDQGSTPNNVYESAIETLEKIYKSKLDGEIFNEAFTTAQKFNAFVLREQLSEKAALELIEVNDGLKEKYRSVKNEVVDLSFRLQNEYTDSLFLQSEIANKLIEKLESEINEKDIRFQQLRNDVTVSSTHDIQKTLSKNACLIKYFWGVHSLYIFAITKEETFLYKKDEIDIINKRIGTYRQILGSNKNDKISESSFLSVSHELYKDLLELPIIDLSDKITELIVVPDGSLNKIPFEALIIKEATEWNSPENYLLSKYDIGYRYYCKQLVDNQNSQSNVDFFSFGLEYDKFTLEYLKKSKRDTISSILNFRSEEFSSLRFADDEALELANTFGGKSFINENATKENFLHHSKEAGILHISAHSHLDLETPENSSIIFSKENKETDNLLKVNDIYGLELNCQLVTLSACNTSFGRSTTGEGLISIARAFNQAGCNSIVGSFWSVPDEISKTLMTTFYKKLLSGMDKDQALRATKLEYLTNDNLSTPAFRSPNYWASWVIYGDTNAIQSKPAFKCYILLSSLLACILLIGLWYYRFKQSN